MHDAHFLRPQALGSHSPATTGPAQVVSAMCLTQLLGSSRPHNDMDRACTRVARDTRVTHNALYTSSAPGITSTSTSADIAYTGQTMHHLKKALTQPMLPRLYAQITRRTKCVSGHARLRDEKKARPAAWEPLCTPLPRVIVCSNQSKSTHGVVHLIPITGGRDGLSPTLAVCDVTGGPAQFDFASNALPRVVPPSCPRADRCVASMLELLPTCPAWCPMTVCTQVVALAR